MSKSKISWTDRVWNPVTGCDKISPGCKHCYAEALTKRFPKTWPNGFNVTLHQDRIAVPSTWRQPAMVFVNSMSDLFHPEIPAKFLWDIWNEMLGCPQHTFQVLTKRPESIPGWLMQSAFWPDNIWLGVSAENQEYYEKRIVRLAAIPAQVRFISAEPLLGPIDLYQPHFDWVIVGGESGPNRREMDLNWARVLRDQCARVGIPFFYKQGNATRPGNDTLLDGVEHKAMPEALYAKR